MLYKQIYIRVKLVGILNTTHLCVSLNAFADFQSCYSCGNSSRSYIYSDLEPRRNSKVGRAKIALSKTFRALVGSMK